MHIAYITETWPPEVNGVALTAARAVSYLRGRGHDVDVIRPRQGSEDRGGAGTLLVGGIPLPFYPDLRMGLPAGRKLFDRWDVRRPDVVHVATEGPLGWSAVTAANRLGIPVTTDFRTRFDEYGGIYANRFCVGLVRSYLRAFHNRALCTFVPTEEVRRNLASQGFHDLIVSSRGVDPVAFAPNYRSLSLRQAWRAHGPVALYVGRLAPEKNLRLVIQAYEAMRAVEPETRLVIVGDGPSREDLQRECPEAIFAGVKRGAELAACYASADVFLFPSLTETFGNVTLEAMASGLAVVAFDTAAAALHIKSGVNGLTVAPGDATAFRAAAARLAADETLCETLGTAARNAARQASWSGILAEFESILMAARATGDVGVGAYVV